MLQNFRTQKWCFRASLLWAGFKSLPAHFGILPDNRLSFPSPKQLDAIQLAYVVKPSLYQRLCLVDVACYFAYEAFVLFLKQCLFNLNVYESVFDAFVAEELHDVQDVFGLVVELSCFPVSEGVKVGLK